MDNLVLIRVAAALQGAFGHSLVREVREPSPDRLRLQLQAEDSSAAVVLCLTPELPWIGRPGGRWDAPRRPPSPFAARCAKALTGQALRGIEKLGADRVVALRFADGSSLVAELATHGANLVLLDGAGVVLATARKPRSGHARLHPGAAYAPPPLPAGKLVPFDREPEEIDRFLADRCRATGDSPFEVLRRHVFGIGSEGAGLVLAEAARAGETPGSVLASRLRLLAEGSVDPVVEAGGLDPMGDADAGVLDPLRLRLLPWDFGVPGEGTVRIVREDAAATAGLYHDARERAGLVRARGEALRAILHTELQRTRSALRRVEADLEGLAEPDRHRIWGEALLAGLSVARRAGDHAIVPDPYDAQGNDLIIPAPASRTLPEVAEDQFRRHRKARRGAETARGRRDALDARGARLQALGLEFEGAVSAEASLRLAERMRAEGLAVGLEPRTHAGRTAARARPPRLEGVRLYTSTEGEEILVGRTGKDNDRLTFRLAGSEDFWLHASGSAGAHVIIRNPKREARPSRATLAEAARLAAWWSDARGSAQVDVQWTRRKHVHRIRGAAPGTVRVKKSESILVRPGLPAGSEDAT